MCNLYIKIKSTHITIQEASVFLEIFLDSAYRGSTKYSDILDQMECYYNKPASIKARQLLSVRLKKFIRSRNKNKTRIPEDFL